MMTCRHTGLLKSETAKHSGLVGNGQFGREADIQKVGYEAQN